MSIEMLLEERSTVQSKIKKALTTTKEWFENKIESAKESFDNTKLKVKNYLSKVTKSLFKGKVSSEKITVKAEGKNINVANVGDNAETVFEKISRIIEKMISKMKTVCSVIIKQCSEAISSIVTIEKIDYEAIARAERKEALKQARLQQIQESKEKVADNMRTTAEIIAVTTALLSAISKLKNVSQEIKEKKGKVK